MSAPNVSYGNRKVALANEILRTTVGSGVHGIAIAGTDDHDGGSYLPTALVRMPELDATCPGGKAQ